MTTISNPTFLLGVGRFGQEVVRAVQHEGDRLRAHTGAPGLANLASLVAVESETDAAAGDIVITSTALETDALWEGLREGVRRLLKLRHRLDTKDAAQSSSPPRLDLFIIADVNEELVLDHLGELLERAAQEVERAFSPIFKKFRSGENANFALIPLLMTPHPPSSDRGGRIREALLAVELAHAKAAGSLGAMRQLYLVEDVSGHYVLDRAELAEMFSSFLNFLLYSNLRSEPEFRQLYQRATHGDLFATFSCATLEFPQHLVLDYCNRRLAHELLAHFSADTRTLPTPIREDLRTWFDAVCADTLSSSQAREVAREGMVHNVPDVFNPFPFFKELDEPARLRDVFTETWLDERLEPFSTLEKATTAANLDQLLKKRDDATDTELDIRVEELQRHLDDLLEGARHRAHLPELIEALEALTTHLHARKNELEARLEDNPAPAPPDLQPIRDQYDAFRDSIAELESPGRLKLMLGAGVAGVVVLGTLGIILLPTVILGLSLLGAAGALAAGIIPTLGRKALNWYKAAQQVRAFTGAGDQTGSLVGAWKKAFEDNDVSVLASLAHRVAAHIDGAHVARLDRAAAAVDADTNRLREVLTNIAATTDATPPPEQTLDADPDRDALFIRYLIDDDDLELLYTGRCQTTDLETLSRQLRTKDKIFADWRATTPLETPAALAALTASHLTGLEHHNAFTLPELGDRVDRKLERFLGDFADTLTFHLDFRGYEAQDATGVVHRAHRLVLVAEPGHAAVLDACKTTDASGWQVRPKMVDVNRVHLLRVATDIHSGAIHSLSAEHFEAEELPEEDPEGDEDGDDQTIIPFQSPASKG